MLGCEGEVVVDGEADVFGEVEEAEWLVLVWGVNHGAVLGGGGEAD